MSERQPMSSPRTALSPRGQPGATPTRTRDPSAITNARSPRPDSARPEDLQQMGNPSGGSIRTPMGASRQPTTPTAPRTTITREPTGGPTRTPPSVSTSRSRVPQGTSEQELSGTGQGKGDISQAPDTGLRRDSALLGTRSQLSRAQLKERRVSKILLGKEMKSDFWQQIIKEVNTNGVFNQEDIQNFINRAVSLGVVPDYKEREAQGQVLKGNEAREIVAKVDKAMYDHIVSLTGKQVNIGQTGLEKIKKMETFLLALEAKREKENAEKAKQVESKISELTQAIQVKEKERETHRRSVMMEIGDLKKQMQQASSGQSTSQSPSEIASKMKQMEAALEKMNKEKEQDDAQTENLKKKLAAFESKFKQMEEEKALSAQAEKADVLRDKVIMMEDKLRKMENRKSVSITMHMQQQMQKLEEELRSVRSGTGGGSDPRVSQLEKQILQLQNQKVSPMDINDPETRALRSTIKKLEEQMLASERALEENAKQIELERKIAAKKKQEEEESQRLRQKKHDELFINKMMELENAIKKGSGGITEQQIKALEDKYKQGSGGGGASAALVKQMEEMQARIARTEETIQKERSTNSMLHNFVNKEGNLSTAEKDMEIENLKKTTEMLMARLESMSLDFNSKVDDLNKKVENIPVGGGGQVVVRNTGMSYAELQAKMEEIQVKLFNPDIEERESEALNIEYEKLVTELESTKEYQAERAAEVQKWKDDNKGPNTQALEKLRSELASYPPMKKTAALKRKPELKFLDCDFDQIMKKHVNDFKGLTTQNLTLEEARALYCCMPEFRKDQEAQLQFVSQLKEKIDNELKKPKVKPPPPIVAKNPVVFKPKPQRGGPAAGDGGGDFLAELMKKRKQQQ